MAGNAEERGMNQGDRMRTKTYIDRVFEKQLIENSGGLARLARDLRALENYPRETESLGDIVPMIHTLGGDGGTAGSTHLDAVARLCVKTVCGKSRDGVITYNPERANALLTKVIEILSLAIDVEISATSKPPKRQESQSKSSPCHKAGSHCRGCGNARSRGGRSRDRGRDDAVRDSKSISVPPLRDTPPFIFPFPI